MKVLPYSILCKFLHFLVRWIPNYYKQSKVPISVDLKKFVGDKPENSRNPEIWTALPDSYFSSVQNFITLDFCLLGVDSSRTPDQNRTVSAPSKSVPIVHDPIIEVEDGSYIYVHMFNGTVYGGRLRLRPDHALPTWMRLRHEHHYIYVRMPSGVGLDTRLIYLPDEVSGHPGIMEAIIIQNNVPITAILSPLGNNLRQNSKTTVYVGMENGILLSGIFAPLW